MTSLTMTLTMPSNQPTATATKTKTVSALKLGVATLGLALSLNFAAALLPSSDYYYEEASYPQETAISGIDYVEVPTNVVAYNTTSSPVAAYETPLGTYSSGESYLGEFTDGATYSNTYDTSYPATTETAATSPADYSFGDWVYAIGGEVYDYIADPYTNTNQYEYAPAPMPQITCGETDNGADAIVAGTTTLRDAGGNTIASDRDTCASPATLREFFCDGLPGADPQSYVTEDVQCAGVGPGFVCQNGACAAQQLAGLLEISLDPESPSSTNHLLGDTDQIIAKFRLVNKSMEDIAVKNLVTSALFFYETTPGVKNIRLFDAATGAQLGQTNVKFSNLNGQIFQSPYANGTFSHATFSNFNLIIPKGTSKTVAIKVDFTKYSDLPNPPRQMGSYIYPGILTTSTDNVADKPASAVGLQSGLPTDVKIIVSKYPDGAFADGIILYRAKLAIAWANDTPSGNSIRASSQLIGKLVITNLANAGNYTAEVQLMNFDFASSIPPATAPRVLTVYKDALGNLPLATFTFPLGSHFNGGTFIDEGLFTDFQLASGASKTLFVTLDTSDALATTNLAMRINYRGIIWGDGVIRNISLMGYDLPLQFKNFSY